MDSLLRTDLHAWMFQTALTSFCCHDSLLRTGIAGEFDHIDKRRFVIFFFYNTGFHTFGDWRMLCDFSQRHSHCHTQTLTNDCPLQKNTVSVSCNLSRDDLIWKFFQYLSGDCSSYAIRAISVNILCLISVLDEYSPLIFPPDFPLYIFHRFSF